jgi:hypothetical protein
MKIYNIILLNIMIIRILSALIAVFFIHNAIAQEKEILIVGTMHEVPSIVSHSYRPLLKYAKKYAPEAIFVEDICPDDSLSMKNFTPKFLKVADSLAKVDVIDENLFLSIKDKRLSEMEKSDFEFLANAYLRKRDRANYTFYDYLNKYGFAGPKKPLRKENGDFIFPLAISMGITELLPVDDHQSEPEYQRAWKAAMRAIKGTDNEIILDKLLKDDRRSKVWPAILGRLGTHTNKYKTLQRFYEINSCRYVSEDNECYKAVRQLWDERNRRIAINITEQIKSHSFRKHILIIGAGHVISVKEMLNQVYPDLHVILMFDEDL